MLRAIADYGLNNGIKFNLIGIDANNFTIKRTQSLSQLYKYRFTVKIFCAVF
jgi:hypothetical protein